MSYNSQKNNIKHIDIIIWGFPHSLVSKESVCNAGDPVSIPGSGRSPGEGNGNLLQYCCLENPMDKGSWQATGHGLAKELDRTERLNNNIAS